MPKALTRRRTAGETTVRPGRGHKPPKLAPFYTAIRAYVAERGDTTIATLRAWLLATHQGSASVGLIWHTLKLLGLSLKTYGPPRLQASVMPDISSHPEIAALRVVVAVSRGADFRPDEFQAGVLRRPDWSEFQDTILQPFARPGNQRRRSRLFVALNSVEMIFCVPSHLMAFFPETEDDALLAADQRASRRLATHLKR